MKLDLKDLKLKTVASEDYHFNARFSDEILIPFRGRFDKPVDVYLNVENTGRIFLAQGKLKTKVVFECSRCLKEFVFPVELNLHFNIAEKAYLDNCDEEETLFFTGDELDITSYLEEEILLSLPLQPLCDKECRGLCPGCGADLNIDSCRCKEKNIDPRWEKLKQLK